MKRSIVCYHCAKFIRGALKLHRALTWADDFDRAYHPSCYRRAEAAAGRELKRGVRC